MPIGQAFGQSDFPNRPIKLVVTVAPGSAGDTVARRLAEPLGKLLGQPVIVENRPGAQGAIASRLVARASPDGYTLLLAGNSSHAANVYMMKDLGYDPVKDFTPITQLTINPLILVVRADSPMRTIKDFIRYAKDHPGKLCYGTGNSGSLVAAQLLKEHAGIDAVGVGYAGTAQATNDLLGGRLDFIMLDPVVAAPFVRAGKLRTLGITTKQRLPTLADVAPLSEQGLSGFEYYSWIAMFGPRGLPAELTQRIQQALVKAMSDPVVAKFATDAGMIPTTTTPQGLHDFLLAQIKAWGRWTKEAGLQAEPG